MPRIANSVGSASRKGVVLGPAVFVEEWWVPVLWEGESVPTLVQAAAITIKHVPRDKGDKRKGAWDV